MQYPSIICDCGSWMSNKEIQTDYPREGVSYVIVACPSCGEVREYTVRVDTMELITKPRRR